MTEGLGLGLRLYTVYSLTQDPNVPAIQCPQETDFCLVSFFF